MQLLYIWVEEYKCFKNEGFNFSPKHKFEFNHDTSTLVYWKNNNCIEDFFSNSNYDEKKKDNGIINNLTAIVGNNGAGKTTLLEIISQKFVNERYELEMEGLVCFIDDGNIKVYWKFKNDEDRLIYLKTDEMNEGLYERYKISGNIKSNYLNNIKKFVLQNSYKSIEGRNNISNIQKFKEDTYSIYYSNTFDYRYYQYNQNGIAKDISTMCFIRSDKANAVGNLYLSEDYDPVINYFNNDFYREIKFVCDCEGKDEYIEFNLPNYINVKFADLDFAISNIYKKLNEKYAFMNIKQTEDGLNTENAKKENSESFKIKLELMLLIKKIVWKLKSFEYNVHAERRDINSFGVKLISGIFIQFIYNYTSVFFSNEKNTTHKILVDNLDKHIVQNLDKINDVNDIIKYFVHCIFCIVRNENWRKGFDKEVLSSLIKFSKWIKTDPIEKIHYNLDGTFYLKVSSDEDRDLVSLSNFYNVYWKTARFFNYLEFSWKISTGEYNMISLFSRFYNLIDEKSKLLSCLNNRIKNNDGENIRQDVIILIDEADMTFHPEWQQKYIKKLTNFLEVTYKKCNIQIILTTHSPIMLSDIPNDNVIFLYKGEEGNPIVKDIEVRTFGSNIYNLYREGFFLKGNNFGLLGDFATYQIERVQNIISEIARNIDEIEKELNQKQNEFNENEEIIDRYELEKIRLRMIDDIKEESLSKLKDCKKIINIIGEKFIRDIILEQYNDVYKRLEIKREEISKVNVDEIKSTFEQLSLEDQNELIQYIIQVRKK